MKKSFDQWLTTVFTITITMGSILFPTALYTLHIRKHLPQPPQVSVTAVSTTVRGVDVVHNRVTARLNVAFLFENTGKKAMIVDHVTLSASQLINHKNHHHHLTIANNSDSLPVAAIDHYQEDDYSYDACLENVTAEVEHWDRESGAFYVDFALTYDVTYRSGNVIVPWSKQRTIGMEVGCENLKVPFSSNETITTDHDGGGGGGDGGSVLRRCSSNGEDVLEKVGDWLFIEGTFLLTISMVLFYFSVVIIFFKFFVFLLKLETLPCIGPSNKLSN